MSVYAKSVLRLRGGSSIEVYGGYIDTVSVLNVKPDEWADFETPAWDAHRASSYRRRVSVLAGEVVAIEGDKWP